MDEPESRQQGKDEEVRWHFEILQRFLLTMTENGISGLPKLLQGPFRSGCFHQLSRVHFGSPAKRRYRRNVIIGLFPVASSLVLRFDDHIPRVPAGYHSRDALLLD